MRKRDWFFDWGTRRFGLQTNTVFIRGSKYLSRVILYVGGLNLRLHKFYQGDDDRAPHDHPWWFITFPLSSYVELVESYDLNRDAWLREYQVVRRFNFHYRAARHRHIVIGRTSEGKLHPGGKIFNAYRMKKPFWTIVIAGPRDNDWGFYPEPTKFVPWREWK